MKKVLLILPVIFFISCTSQKEIQEAAYPNLFDGKYDSEFPYKSSSEQLEEISNSIRLVNSIAFYKTFYFAPKWRMTLSEIRRGNDYQNIASKSTTFEETASGTGTVIYNFDKNIAVLTCSHIIEFPDSVITYYRDENNNKTGLIESISIIQKKSIYFVPFPESSEMEIVIQDQKLDVAVLKTVLETESLISDVSTFDYTIGSASELDWGSFVYVFGFPMNYKMISKGIVSSPNRDQHGSFLIDAVFNQGYSGGIVLAIRDGVPNFELVGMVKSVPADYEYVLRPKMNDDLSIGTEYKGNPVIDSRANIKYGVTRILSIDAIIEYLDQNEDKLKAADYLPERFFK